MVGVCLVTLELQGRGSHSCYHSCFLMIVKNPYTTHGSLVVIHHESGIISGFLGMTVTHKVEIFVNQAVQCDGVGAFFAVRAELV